MFAFGFISYATVLSPPWRQNPAPKNSGRRRKRFPILLLFSILSGRVGAADYRLYFPQVADGGGYKTTLLLTNRSPISTTATVSFFDGNGSPMKLKVGEIEASSFSLDLPAEGSASLQSRGQAGTASTGWAAVSVSPQASINGNAVFQLYHENALYSEASVPATMPTNRADFYADEEGGFHTGYAIVNPNPAAVTGTITLRKKDGTLVGTSPLEMDPGHHQATFLFQTFPGATAGRAEISLTSGTMAVTALRYHASSVFSTVAVGQTPIEALFSPLGGVQSRIVAEIDKARSSIDIAIYSFTADSIREALLRAKDRGVAIRIVADTSQASNSGGEIPTLQQAGFQIKLMTGLAQGIMHHKYLIVDGETLCTGSYNWSRNAEEFNFENMVLIQGSPVIRDFQSNFEALWIR
jgi:hypothetical protein